jgi:membrane-associated phospholipid phosphatase
MDYLWETNKIVPIQALAGQEYLWTIYEKGILVWGSGISAMPSVHVSMAFLYVLLTYRRHPIAFWAFCLYALLIMIGSIHLGWHYAVDGYVAIPCTWIIWWIIGKLQKQSSFSHVGQQ